MDRIMSWVKRRIEKMSIRQSLFVIMLTGILAAAVLSAATFFGCILLREKIAPQGIYIGLQQSDPSLSVLALPSEKALRFSILLEVLQLLLPVLFFTSAILLASALFYRLKLKDSLGLLKNGADRIMNQDLNFTIPAAPASDELQQLCAAFENMRKALLANHRTLWRQSEEQKRLNAAFAHNLRNPVTVLKGTIRLLERTPGDSELLNQLSLYTLRIEQYIEAMSSIQRLDHMLLRKEEVSFCSLKEDLCYTAKHLAPSLSLSIAAAGDGRLLLDCRCFLLTAENLIGNAARFAKTSLSLCLEQKDGFLILTVADDGPGYPPELLQKGPLPFKSMVTKAEKTNNPPHFGIGLYTGKILCMNHGGNLTLKNIICPQSGEIQGAKAAASFQIENSSHPL